MHNINTRKRLVNMKATKKLKILSKDEIDSVLVQTATDYTVAHLEA